MESYIRKSIAGYFVEFPEEIDSIYWQGKIGTTYQDFNEDKWIHLSDEQIEFYHNNPYATIEEIINMSLIPRTLEQAKKEKIEQIIEYDNSENVNGFIVRLSDSNIEIIKWWTPAERSNHKGSIDAAEILGQDTIDVPLNGRMYTLTIQFAKESLAKIQLYADQCSLVTEMHKSIVNSLDTIESVDNYDNTQSYPQMLTFTLE